MQIIHEKERKNGHARKASAQPEKGRFFPGCAEALAEGEEQGRKSDKNLSEKLLRHCRKLCYNKERRNPFTL